MQSRVLIINCASEYFVHIPMGTFGLCDFIGRKDIPVRLLNLALYKNDEMGRTIDHYLNLFKPTHVGLVFHWQETAEGVLSAGEYIKSGHDGIKIICGGFTAGYFGGALLKDCGFIDYIIKGDPEKPLELLLSGVELSEIPNLIYRTRDGIVSNGVTYHIDQDTISQISFCRLDYLYDHELYVEAVEKKLGFPVFIGRGCSFNCRYCGGSSDSFKLHSGRNRPVVRSIDAIIDDLRLLKDFTRRIYICYENDRSYIKSLFQAIKRERTLVNVFQLNYGAWQLFDREFLELYESLFFPDSEKKPIFEISPEVFSDKGRRKIKRRRATYPMEDLKENLNLIRDCLGNSVNVSVFFSRYHDTAKTYSEMKKEVAGIFCLKHDLLCSGIVNTGISYDHLSTDVGSRYWEDYVERPRDFDSLISAIQKTEARNSFPINNLCMYIPETLSGEEIFRCELLISTLKAIEEYFYELFHIMLRCLGEIMIDVIEEIITDVYSNRPGNFFAAIDYCELLNNVKLRILQRGDLLSMIPFIEDLIDLNIKKGIFQRRSQTVRSLHETNRPRLNHDFISIHNHDYLDLSSFLKRLEKEGLDNLSPEKTVYIFLVDEILSVSYETYCSTLKMFENDISIDEYCDFMEKNGIFNPSYHRDLVAKLLQSGVLTEGNG